MVIHRELAAHGKVKWFGAGVLHALEESLRADGSLAYQAYQA